MAAKPVDPSLPPDLQRLVADVAEQEGKPAHDPTPEPAPEAGRRGRGRRMKRKDYIELGMRPPARRLLPMFVMLIVVGGL